MSVLFKVEQGLIFAKESQHAIIGLAAFLGLKNRQTHKASGHLPIVHKSSIVV